MRIKRCGREAARWQEKWWKRKYAPRCRCTLRRAHFWCARLCCPYTACRAVWAHVPFATGEEALDAALEKARDDLEKLEVLNARIPAAALSAQISRMEKAGAAILQQVREHPEKGRDIRKFVTYYLPTAVKILTTYADLSASGAGGENAKSLMSDVEKNAGTIAAAFEAQLDALFAGEVLDVSSDIAVLDGMLSGDGLSGKNNLKLS